MNALQAVYGRHLRGNKQLFCTLNGNEKNLFSNKYSHFSQSFCMCFFLLTTTICKIAFSITTTWYTVWSMMISFVRNLQGCAWHTETHRLLHYVLTGQWPTGMCIVDNVYWQWYMTYWLVVHDILTGAWRTDWRMTCWLAHDLTSGAWRTDLCMTCWLAHDLPAGAWRPVSCCPLLRSTSVWHIWK